MDALFWTVLWRVSDVLKSSGDPPMDSSPYSCQEDWTGLEVHLKDSAGLLISSGQINCLRPDDLFQDITLGEEKIGVIVLDVFVGNPEDIMTHARWPISDCWFPNGQLLNETLDHFASIPKMQDPLAYLGGRVKAPYRFIVRRPSVQQRDFSFTRKTIDEEIRMVSSNFSEMLRQSLLPVFQSREDVES